MVESLAEKKVSDFRDEKQVKTAVLASLTSKMMGYDHFLADLAVKACIRILPENAKGFDVEYIRV